METKMKIFTIGILLCMAQAVTAQAGTNALLEVESTNKGLLLPRLNDTSSVSNPSSGLMIYNNNTQSPAFFNGTAWNTLAVANLMPPVNTGDSLTYTLSGPGSYFINGTYPMYAFSEGGSAGYFPGGPPPTQTNWFDLAFTKPRDINSVPFLNSLAGHSLKGQIEIKIYESGASTPYYSIKLSNFYVTSVSLGTSTAASGLSENVSLSGLTLGFKDWVNNISFSVNLDTGALGSY